MTPRGSKTLASGRGPRCGRLPEDAMFLRSSFAKILAPVALVALVATVASGCGGCEDESAICDAEGNCEICDAYGCHPANPTPSGGAGGAGSGNSGNSSTGSGNPCDPTVTTCPC